MLKNFNSHTREGVTTSFKTGLTAMNFNSHTREGVTVSIFMIPTYFANFNSHTREGVTKDRLLKKL